jgi:acyl-CoA hydrolase/RimJ/RimL family protein N-acetyltransferase
MKTVPPATITGAVRNGERIVLGTGCAVPQTLLEALMEHAPRLADVEVAHLRIAATPAYGDPALEGCLRHHALGRSPATQPLIQQGRADVTPLSLSEMPAWIRSGALPIHQAWIQVSTPDRHGRVSLGPSADILPAVLATARTRIAEINPHMPRTEGRTGISLSRFDFAVESDRPLAVHPDPVLSEEALTIGRHVAALIPDGAVFRTGLGEIAHAVTLALAGKNDLGLHSEVFTSAHAALLASGVLTGRLNRWAPRLAIATAAFGDAPFLQSLHRNKKISLLPAEWVCQSRLIARHPGFVAVLTPATIDLTGQTCADEDAGSSLGACQADFVRGTRLSKGGRGIHALKSLHPDGTSAIVLQLPAGPPVLTGRNDIDTVVTEFGTARLHGKTLRERALALIQIAHPRHREQLLDEARRHGLVHPRQIPFPKGMRPYPAEYETVRRFPRTGQVRIRPIRPADEDRLRDLFYSHSEETILNRYFTVFRKLPHAQLQRFVTLDYRDRMALVAVREAEPDEPIIGVCRYDREEGSDRAEIAVTIHDAFQGRGLGTALVTRLADIARQNGFHTFTASVLADNAAMLAVFRSLFRKITIRREDHICHLTLPLD